MLKLNHINLKYGNQLIVSGELEIKEGQLTLITGESGSGKSSLLNMLGLILNNVAQQCEYIINDETMDLYNSNVIRQIQREYISYVFQDYNLLDSMSIEDNFKTMFDIANIRYQKEKVKEYLELVGLEEVLNKKVKNLSGGERQRLAIALALVKDPQLILLDEPTANLDVENSQKVIEILNQLKKQGKMIVVSSHHKAMYEAETIYTIENKKINCIKSEESKYESKAIGYTPFNRKFNLKYGIRKFFNGVTLNGILIVILGVAVGFIAFICLQGESSVSNQKEKLNQIAKTDILVTNTYPVETENVRVEYSETNIGEGFNEEMLQEIAKIENVETLYPYHYFTVLEGQVKEDGSWDYSSIKDKTELIVLDENKQEIARYNPLVKEEGIYRMQEKVALTSWDEYNVEDEVVEMDSSIENGVYISSNLYDYLGIEDIIGKTLKFNVHIPFAATKSELTISAPLEQGKTLGKYTKPSFKRRLRNVEVVVKGVLKWDDSSAFYDSGDVFHVYMNTQQLDNYIKEVNVDKEEFYQKFLDANGDDLLYDRDDNLYTMDYSSSSIIVRVSDYQKVGEVNKQIKLLSDYYSTKTKIIEMESAKKLSSQYVMQNIGLPLVMSGMLIVLICAIYYYRMKRNKKEYALLKAYGIEKIENTLLYELIILGGLEVIVSFITTGILLYRYKMKYNITVPLDTFALIVPLISVIMCMIIPYLIAKHMIKKIDTSILVRSS